jgi:C4-dicarboxylate-specific signal transduction histidine kinase
LAVIKRLLEDGSFQVTAVVRTTSQYSPPSSEDIKTATADFESLPSLVDALGGHDALVCCVGGTQTKFDPQKLLIDASIQAGLKLFFASEYSGNILSPHYRMLPTQFVGEKLRIREYLEEKAAAGQIAYAALNGGPFFDMCEFHTRSIFPNSLLMRDPRY